MPGMFVFRCRDVALLRFVMTREIAIVGRALSCTFVVNDQSVSRHHAELRLERNHVAVFDLKSRNGTFVDEERISTCTLLPGQSIRFGDIGFVVTLEDRNAILDGETDDVPEKKRSRTAYQSIENALSPAQRRVFQLLMFGLAEKAIARRLNLSQHTVHNHTRRIFQILGVHSRAGLLAKYLQVSRSAATAQQIGDE
jgi:pSer/pThr/pTyr-binding forkhead associated (FHA) protein